MRSDETEQPRDEPREKEEETQETPGGITIPVPTREQIEDDLRKAVRPNT